jgi:Na+-transporting methylmalonyl-CoA/oxaloacetate decarboxylase beta subunit
MKKLFCIIALGAISFGSVMAAVPVKHSTTMNADTTKKKVKVKKDGTKKVKVKKDSV